MKSKKLLFLTAATCLLALNSGIAQTIPAGFEDISPAAPIIKSYLQRNFTEKQQPRLSKSLKTAKTTAVQSRLYAYSSYTTDGVSFLLHDTSAYSYSPDRGGDLRTADIKYDEQQTQSYDATAAALLYTSKALQTFDANNVLLSRTQQIWSKPLGDWINTTKLVLENSSTGKILTETYLVWNSSTSVWENTQQYTYTYDGSGRITGTINAYWDAATLSWLNNWKYGATYDAAGNPLSLTTQSWDASTLSWLDNFRQTNSYNTKNKIVKLVTENFDIPTSAWVNNSQRIYQYDASELQLQTEANQVWNTGSSSWTNQNKLIYTYSGLTNSTITQTWTSGSWLNKEKEVELYDAAGNRTAYTHQNWNPATSTWINTDHLDASFDGRNNNTVVIFQDWNTAAAKWDSLQRSQMTYNTNDQMTSSISDSWNSGGFWEYTTANTKDYFYYEEYTTGIGQTLLKGASLKLYPVPAQNELQVALQWQQAQSFSVTVYDIQGRVWQSWQQPAAGNYTATIPTGNLAAGSYWIQFSGHNGARAVQQFSVIR